jgi:hypothetical protein
VNRAPVGIAAIELLASFPELAVLEASDAVLGAVVRALLVANPELLDGAWPFAPALVGDELVDVGREILAGIDALREKIQRYRELSASDRELRRERRPDDFPWEPLAIRERSIEAPRGTPTPQCEEPSSQDDLCADNREGRAR